MVPGMGLDMSVLSNPPVLPTPPGRQVSGLFLDAPRPSEIVSSVPSDNGQPPTTPSGSEAHKSVSVSVAHDTDVGAGGDEEFSWQRSDDDAAQGGWDASQPWAQRFGPKAGAPYPSAGAQAPPGGPGWNFTAGPLMPPSPQGPPSGFGPGVMGPGFGPGSLLCRQGSPVLPSMGSSPPASGFGGPPATGPTPGFGVVPFGRPIDGGSPGPSGSAGTGPGPIPTFLPPPGGVPGLIPFSTGPGLGPFPSFFPPGGSGAPGPFLGTLPGVPMPGTGPG